VRIVNKIIAVLCRRELVEAMVLVEDFSVHVLLDDLPVMLTGLCDTNFLRCYIS